MTTNTAVIVTYNSERTIESCLSSIPNSDVDVVVVDNNSTDRTVETSKNFPEVKLIRNEQNLGFGKANNIGAKNSNSKYILFLNPDSKLEGDAVEKLASYLDTHSDVAVVGPKLLNSDSSIQKEIARFPTLFSQILILLRAHRLPFLGNFAYQNLDYNKTQEAEHLMGAALLVRREVFEKVGGFDENFFLWFEETDLLKRIEDKGYKIIYYPEAVVTHLVGQSTKQLSFWKRQTIWNKSLIYYFSKNKTWLHVLFLIPFILLSYVASFITSLVKR